MTEPEDTPQDATCEQDSTLPRPQRRLLARLFNGRSEPVLVDDRQLHTFQDAKRYLLALKPDDRDAAYEQIKKQAQ